MAPKPLHIVSHNVTSSEPHSDATLSIQADGVALQEARLDHHGQNSYTHEASHRAWGVQHGKPMPWIKTQTGTAKVRPGGVLIQAKHPSQIRTVQQYTDSDENLLHQSHRWATARIPVNQGKVRGRSGKAEAIIIDNSYCGQQTDRQATLDNERHLRRLFHVAGQRQGVPVILCIGTNLPFAKHALFQSLMQEGHWVGAADLQFAVDGKPPQPT